MRPHHVQLCDAAGKQRSLEFALRANSTWQWCSREAGCNKVDGVNPSLEFLAVTVGSKKMLRRHILEWLQWLIHICSVWDWITSYCLFH